ncbi:unnamed protein product [Ceutorhynchus assimilis]|uniref:Stabilizer of axonemal microtubules 1 n=1 Tax=Ceutorhynchus assimilis TaxID=467358 RepID=A0A9N9N2J4_9CUCU|nr:unnamed protein product [Ceutorhynchus assimilis]
MASCKPCGRLAKDGSSPRHNLTCPPCPCPPCGVPVPGPPPVYPCPPPCTLPIVADGIPKYVVNPCDPNARARPDKGKDNPLCCNVCVPVTVSCPPPAPPKPRRRCKYIQPNRPQSYAPERKYLPPDLKMEDGTIYKKSYIPAIAEKPKQIIPENNLCVGEGKFAEDTINRMSYKPVKIDPACPFYPCEHKLIGEGPMQDLTTNKHDYVPKPFVKPEAVKPFTNLFTSDCPLSDKTVNRMSYMPIDLNKAKVTPFHPTNAIEKPTGKISDKTVNKMSYQPWEPTGPIDKPWAEKPKYQAPKLKMEDNTVNKMSYKPPGHYVECDDDDPDCIECPESVSILPSAQQACRGPKVCCLPCCCPRASF